MRSTGSKPRAACRNFGLIAAVLTLAAVPVARAQECQTLDAVEWLLGEWATTPLRTVTRESWVRVSDATFEGESVTTSVADGTVVNYETLRLLAMSDGVFYLAKVTENDLPVAFRLTNCSDGNLVFENPAHDAPQRISYRPVRSSSSGRPLEIEVRVEGGAMQGFTLSFTRQ